MSAQPSVEELADQMSEVNQHRLADIESLEYTVKLDVAGFQTETVSRFLRTENNGTYSLIPEGEQDSDSELIGGVYDGSVQDLIRSAESVSNDEVNGKSAYRLVIRDQELLNSYSQEELESGDMEFEIEKGTIWIDSSELIPLKMVYEQSEDGSGMTVEITVEDYREYSGLPVAHLMRVNIEGIDQMMSDEEIAEARRALEEYEKQLESMPPAQRDMIRDRMSGQMEQFEQMLESGKAGMTKMEIVDVKVNQ